MKKRTLLVAFLLYTFVSIYIQMIVQEAHLDRVEQLFLEAAPPPDHARQIRIAKELKGDYNEFEPKNNTAQWKKQGARKSSKQSKKGTK